VPAHTVHVLPPPFCRLLRYAFCVLLRLLLRLHCTLPLPAFYRLLRHRAPYRALLLRFVHALRSIIAFTVISALDRSRLPSLLRLYTRTFRYYGFFCCARVLPRLLRLQRFCVYAHRVSPFVTVTAFHTFLPLRTLQSLRFTILHYIRTVRRHTTPHSTRYACTLLPHTVTLHHRLPVFYISRAIGFTYVTTPLDSHATTVITLRYAPLHRIFAAR